MNRSHDLLEKGCTLQCHLSPFACAASLGYRPEPQPLCQAHRAGVAPTPLALAFWIGPLELNFVAAVVAAQALTAGFSTGLLWQTFCTTTKWEPTPK